jgi:uncharacterized membrane protein YcaP (DUF421 family)
MFFDDWHGLVRVIVVGSAAYVALVVMLRTTGKRTLSKMNAFDLVVTVSLGSTLATVLLSADVALVEGVLALALLCCLQLTVAWWSARSRGFRRFVKAEPSLLLFRGRLLEDALLAERVAPEEVMAAVRASGHASFEQVDAVVLETDGSFSVVRAAPGAQPSAMATVDRFAELGTRREEQRA